MERKIYITETERTKCRRVVDAFVELYEESDIVALDAGRYGFVELQYFCKAVSRRNKKWNTVLIKSQFGIYTHTFPRTGFFLSGRV